MQRSTFIIAAAVALLPLIGIAALLWRRFYRDQVDNTVRRVFKNSAVPTGIRMLVRALDFAFVLVLYNTRQDNEIGVYALATLLIGSYLSTFTEFGLGVLLTRESAKNAAATPQLFGVTLALRLLLVAAAVPLIGLVIGSYRVLAVLGLSSSISFTGIQAIWILALTLIPSAYSNAVTAIYYSNERMEVPAAMELVTAVCGYLARVVVLTLGFGIVGISWAAVGVSTATALLFLGLQLRNFFKPRIVWDWQLMRSLVPVALPLMLNNLLNAVFFRFDLFIVRAFGQSQGDALVAKYNIAYQIISIAMIIPSVVTFAVFPVLARRSSGARTGLAEVQNRTLQMLLLIAFPVAMGMCVLAPDLVRLISGRNANEYLPISGDVLAILAWFLPLSFVNGLMQYVLIAIDKQRAITRAFVIGAVFNLAANLAFIPLYGLYAASVITILSEVVLLLVFRPLLKREALWPPLLRLAWRPAVGALTMGGVLFVTRPVIGWVGASMLAPLIYATTIWLLGGFGAEERALARRVLGRSG